MELIHIDFAWKPWRTHKQHEDYFKTILHNVIRHTVPHHGPGELSIAFVDNKTSQSLNKKYRNQDKPTNVLSFGSVQSPLKPNQWGPYRVLGDIVLARETIVEEAKTQKKACLDHIIHLLIHGMLHNLGYDHMTNEDAVRMEALEIDFLQSLNIRNPYLTDE